MAGSMKMGATITVACDACCNTVVCVGGQTEMIQHKNMNIYLEVFTIQS